LLPDQQTVHNEFSMGRSGMKIKYFQDTDTLDIEFRAAEVAETKDLDENTLLDLDKNGQICLDHDRTRERTCRNTQVQELRPRRTGLLPPWRVDILSTAR
jgi:uncharacterized protein YuzE